MQAVNLLQKLVAIFVPVLLFHCCFFVRKIETVCKTARV